MNVRVAEGNVLIKRRGAEIAEGRKVFNANWNLRFGGLETEILSAQLSVLGASAFYRLSIQPHACS